MKLELFSDDLKPEHRHLEPMAVTFDKFTATAQWIIRAVGAGTFFNEGRTQHNVVRPPKSAAGELNVGDTVTWSERCFPATLPERKARFGEGPFRVLAAVPPKQPAALVLEVKGDLEDMHRVWFQKVPA